MSNISNLTQLAQIITQKCLAVQSLEKIQIFSSTPLGLPLARAVYQSVIDLGGLPSYSIQDESSVAYFYLHAQKKQLNHYPQQSEAEAKYFDKFVQIIAPENNAYLSGVDQTKVMARAVLTKKIKEIKLQKPWNLTYYPTPALAQAANLSLEQLTDFYFNCVLQDYDKMSNKMAKFAHRLNQVKTLRFLGQDTDLTISVAGHIWNDQDWKCNLPGGEVFTTPIKNSVNGKIYFNYPLTNASVTMRDIYLEFRDGKVVQAKASQGFDHLQKLLDTDKGSRYLGEVAFGLNHGCNRYMDNVLFDEKMAGTIHVALGESFPECGLDNRSALHLDIIKDMSGKNDRVFADGKIIMKAGKIVD
jgi:aminopeptidase